MSEWACNIYIGVNNPETMKIIGLKLTINNEIQTQIRDKLGQRQSQTPFSSAS